MKLKLTTLLLLAAATLSGQQIQVKSQYELPVKSVEYANNPTLSDDGSLLLFTTNGFAGLYLYDFKAKTEKTISNLQNSGYDPVFSTDNAHVFFRNTTYVDRRKYDALESYNLATGKQTQMLKPQRNLRQARNYQNGVVVQADDKLYKSTFGRTKAAIPVYITSENLRIFVYQNGVKTQITPVKGENINYIWASLSPDNTKILFTAVGKGTFVCDLKGNIVAELGQLNAPVWYNDTFVVGMQDKDDGHVITSSKVLITSIDGKVKQEISDKSHIAMYPTASSKAGKIVYGTQDGKLVVTELEIK